MYARRSFVVVVSLCSLFTSVWLLPHAAASEEVRKPTPPLAEMALGASRVDWQPAVEYERVVLSVAGPGDLFIRREFDARQIPSLTLSTEAGDLLPDGMYTYELRFTQGIGRPSGQALVLSGYLSVRDGSFVTLPPSESEAADEPRASASSGLRNITAEQTIPEDLVVQGNTLVEEELTVQRGACIGISCVPGDEPFYFRLNGSSTRIFFDDPPDGFTASHSWGLYANDSLGSGEYFTLFDIDANRRSFTVEGDAPANALYVRTNGNLGLGTATPAQDIHAMSGNTPTVRLEQDGSGGLSTRTWDIGASHTELFVKDVTNSSSVPLRIKAGAPTDSLVIASDGRVGIGTASPALAHLDVRSNLASSATARLTNSNPTGYPGIEYFDNTGNSGLFFGLDNAAFTTRMNSINNRPIVILTNFVERMRVTPAGNVGIGTSNPGARLEVDGGEVRLPAGQGGTGFTHFNFMGSGQNYIRGTTIIADNGGSVGIGTASPSEELEVEINQDAITLGLVENTNAGANARAGWQARADVGVTSLTTHGSGRTITRYGQPLAGRGEILHTGGNGLLIGTLEVDDLILGTNNTNRLQINGSTGAVTISGNLTVNGTFSNPSSRDLKERFEPLDPRTVLDKFARLPIQEWSYKSDDRKLRHVGPTVEDFQSAFDLGTEGQHIFPMDVQGITMTAVQGLYQVVQEKDAEIATLRQRLAALEELVSKLAAPQ